MKGYLRNTDLLYIFNSAFSPTYRDNLLRIMSIPSGNIVKFRYTTKFYVPENICNRILYGKPNKNEERIRD